MQAAAGASQAGCSPPAADERFAVVLLSQPTDGQQEDAVSLVAVPAGIVAVWEADNRRGVPSAEGARLEFGQAAQRTAAGWTRPPFPVTVIQGTAVEAHGVRAWPADGHLFVTYHPTGVRGNSAAVARIDPGAVWPTSSWFLEPGNDAMVRRPTAAAVGGEDFAGAITNDPTWAPGGTAAAVLFALDPAGARFAETVYANASLLSGDLLLVNWSGRLAAVLEFPPTAGAPGWLAYTQRGPGGWSAPQPIAGGDPELSRARPSVAVQGDRLWVAFERQRTPESAATRIALVAVEPGGVQSEQVVSGASSGASSFAPAVAVMGGRVFVAWVADDDSLTPGGGLNVYYRTVDGTGQGPIHRVNPAAQGSVNGPPALGTDGPRLFAAWTTDARGLADREDSDVVARYLEGDFDADGTLDEADATPAGDGEPAPCPAPAGSPGGPDPWAAAAVAGGAIAGVAAAFAGRVRRDARAAGRPAAPADRLRRPR